MRQTLTLALSKGRILDETLPLLATCGIEPVESPDSSRKLIIETNRDDLRLLIVRASDVPTYVEHGGADLGVAGRDVLLESRGESIYDPVDLGIARCRLMVAGPTGSSLDIPRPRVATKFVELARQHFAAQGRQAEIIKLYGSMELAPLVGMADLIVDLVDTGNTLRANGLEPLETITEISSRLVVNKASLKMEHQRIGALIEDLATAADAAADNK
ncbi:ATP phosphoribosyltransferase [Halorhodospira halochloris]|uniref:ATP phosphoribosyltransferase n=1 Tax=Halorhodospira halochloris TaxID=1052 RepID=A0A0X8XAR6_HALHR|nr:ATP phosphoribosyltransferase [Halorhodospira halochloris]MBK1651671.1 ATP phosphoribosyltransferase [Halorhodospira halochloris]MCG5529593.1 ATP phosphoribosyltransferase [Halorhodospira halochloris]MCG5548128.1 ATP phosphoribosyltransferase [Halorhodospira halochloris]BAU58535.1 ATP phosphoribosyltransferase [Halorhodospira halochloris]